MMVSRMKRRLERAVTVGLVAGMVASSWSGWSVGTPAQAADSAIATAKGAINVITGTIDAGGVILDGSGKVIGKASGASGAGAAESTGEETAAQPADAPIVGNMADILSLSLDNRRAELDRLIGNAIASGKINATQGADLRSELDTLQHAEIDARASDTSLAFSRAVGIAHELETINGRITNIINVPPLSPLIISDADKKSERLVVTTVRRLGTPLNSLGDITAGAVDGTGAVVDAAGKKVTTILATTGGAATAAPKVGTTAFGVHSVVDILDARRAEMERLTYQAERSGKLTADQAATFRFEIYALGNTESEMRGEDGVITFDEAALLAKSIDEQSIPLARALGITLLPFALKDATGNYKIALNAYRGRTVDEMHVNDGDDDGKKGKPRTGDAAAPDTGGGGGSEVTANATTAGASGSTDSGLGINRNNPAGSGDTTSDGDGGGDDFAAAAAPSGGQAPVKVASAATGTETTGTTSKSAGFTSAPVNTATVPIGTTERLVIDYTPDNVPDTWLAIFDSRRMQLEQAIALSFARGKLEDRQANKLRQELAAVSRAIAHGRSGPEPITMDEATVIAGDLDKLSKHIADASGMPPFPVLVADPDARLRIVLENFGNITSVNSIRNVVYAITLDSRRQELENRIESTISSGKLSTEEAGKFRNWLNRIANVQRSDSQTGIVDANKALFLAVEMDLLMSQLPAGVASDLTPLVVGTRFMLIANQVIMVDENSVRRADLEARIDRKVINGQLSDVQASKLRDQINQVTGTAGKGADDASDPKEMAQRFASFDELYAKVQ